MSCPPAKSDVINIVINAAVAVGTIALAVLAVFGESVRRRFLRPKLSVTADTGTPFVEEFREKQSSTDSDEVTRIDVRVRIENTGRGTARSCQVVVSKVLKLRGQSDDFYIFREMTPKTLQDLQGATTFDVIRGVPTYIDIAHIEVVQDTADAEGEVPSESALPRLLLHVEEAGQMGKYLDVEQGKVVVPLQILSENLNTPDSRYVMIYWSGKSLASRESSDFECRIANEDEIKKAKAAKR